MSFNRGQFTPVNARAFAVLAVAAKRQRREQALQPVELTVEPALDTGYVGVRLGRVRAQLDRLDCMMMIERDAAKLDRLAAAQARVSEQERILSGRPLPGQFRPASPKPAASLEHISFPVPR